jgi:DNA-binding winged helix-turn-helix (wHTH) protein
MTYLNPIHRPGHDPEARRRPMHALPQFLPHDRTARARPLELPAGPGGMGLTVVAPDAVPPDAIIVGIVIATPDPDTAAPGASIDLFAGATPTDHRNPATDPPAAVLICAPGLLLDRDGHRVTLDGRDLSLTRREFDLLRHLASHPGRVHTRETLLRDVWKFEDPSYTPPRTVDVHVARLRRKIGHSHAHALALETLRGVGYRWTAERAGAPRTSDQPFSARRGE